MQIATMPAESALREAYAVTGGEDYQGEEAGQRATARVALDRISRFGSGIAEGSDPLAVSR